MNMSNTMSWWMGSIAQMNMSSGVMVGCIPGEELLLEDNRKTLSCSKS